MIPARMLMSHHHGRVGSTHVVWNGEEQQQCCGRARTFPNTFLNCERTNFQMKMSNTELSCSVKSIPALPPRSSLRTLTLRGFFCLITRAFATLLCEMSTTNIGIN